MTYFSFNPFGNQALIIRFDCKKCGHEVISDEIEIPYPDYSADTANDSQTEEEGYAICDKCEEQYDISLYTTYAGGDGSISGLPDDYPISISVISEPYYNEQYEAISSNTQFLQTWKTEIESLKELNNIQLDNPSTDKTLRRQIFIGIIASMETYLSDAFINTTLNSEEFTKRFVSTFHDFKGKMTSLSEHYNVQDKIKDICKQAMLDIIYHNLSKVKGMYKDTLGVDMGDISIPAKAVSTRHDLVHRNGKTKDVKPVEIDKEKIDKLIEGMELFIGNIDAQIENLASEDHF